jgi:hypothetical protein
MSDISARAAQIVLVTMKLSRWLLKLNALSFRLSRVFGKQYISIEVGFLKLWCEIH